MCHQTVRDTTDQFIWESPKTGLPCNPTHFRDVFRKSLEEAGDIRLLTPHSCRHTFATLMKSVKAPDKDKLELIGHTSTEMLRHYQDVDIEALRRITDAL